MIARIAITPGEPAGIGPELVLAHAQNANPQAILVAIACPELLRQRAHLLGLDIHIIEVNEPPVEPAAPGSLYVQSIPLRAPCVAGELNTANAAYVLDTLDCAIKGTQRGEYQAMVTAPVHKGIINDAGTPFSGHTEYLAAASSTPRVVMMLASGDFRVALATTHLPLREVSDALQPAMLSETLEILHHDLQCQFGLAQPNILVLGLNPHAGEGGHMGREEIDVITPVLNQCRARGMQLEGPLPADTAFTPHHLANADAVLAMYHDQGLPVLKYQGFGQAVNITLGLPFIRTSVDHGTALDLAGLGVADGGSLSQAITLSTTMANKQKC